MNIYFGGSFLPPHRGHDQMLQHLLKHPDAEKVFLVPTSQNPLKSADTLFESPNTVKKKFIEAWLSALQKKNVEGLEKLVVDWRELESGDTAYTINTLSELRSEHPHTHWALCVGDDCLKDLDRWKDIETILMQLEEFWIFVRTDEAAFLENQTILSQVPESLRALSTWRVMIPQILAVSSTEIRSLLAQGDAKREALSSLLIPEVLGVLGE
jgi:nicotinate-nucleotide adenylyltransferase